MYCDYMHMSTAIEPLEEAHVFISALCARLLHDALEGEPVEHPQRRVHLRAHRRRTRAVVQYRQLAERVTFTHAAKRLAILDHGELASCDSSDINKYNCGWMMRNKRREIKLIGDVKFSKQLLEHHCYNMLVLYKKQPTLYDCTTIAM